MPEKQKRRVHSFLGEYEAGIVLRWFDDPDRPKNDLVEKYVELEKQLADAFLDGSEHLDNMLKLLNEAFARPGFGWRRRASRHGAYGGYQVKLMPDFPDKPLEEWERKQLVAFNAAVELASKELLHRIRRCAHKECSKRFFAKLAYQHFHSDECRTAALAADPKRKERRAEWMRKHRRTKKLRKLRKRKREGKS